MWTAGAIFNNQETYGFPDHEQIFARLDALREAGTVTPPASGQVALGLAFEVSRPMSDAARDAG